MPSSIFYMSAVIYLAAACVLIVKAERRVMSGEISEEINSLVMRASLAIVLCAVSIVGCEEINTVNQALNKMPLSGLTFLTIYGSFVFLSVSSLVSMHRGDIEDSGKS